MRYLNCIPNPYLYYEGCIKWLEGFNYSSSYFHIRWHLAYEPEIESGNCIKQFGGAESFRFDFQFWKTQHIIMKFLQVILDSRQLFIGMQMDKNVDEILTKATSKKNTMHVNIQLVNLFT